MLPSFTTSNPIALTDFLKIPLNNGKHVKDYLKEIISNIEQTKKKSTILANELSEQLEIQLLIITHGYKGIK